MWTCAIAYFFNACMDMHKKISFSKQISRKMITLTVTAYLVLYIIIHVAQLITIHTIVVNGNIIVYITSHSVYHHQRASQYYYGHLLKHNIYIDNLLTIMSSNTPIGIPLSRYYLGALFFEDN